MKILFTSCHGYLDSTSGAAISARQMLELLAGRGHDCRVFCLGTSDSPVGRPVEQALLDMGIPFRRARARAGDREVQVLDLTLDRVRVTILPTASSSPRVAPNGDEASAYLGLVAQILERFRPDAVVTYGGHPAVLAMMRQARGLGTPVVFFLRNLSYRSPLPFVDASAVLVASQFVREFYRREVGLDCTAIPSPLRPDRVVAPRPEPRYLTFINPSAEKGLTVFARLATELDRSRPDIPLLIVESRGQASSLSEAGLDLSHLRNLSVLRNSVDPRDFYGVSRAILVPSLWQEPFGRVVAEAQLNGLPVLASDRGGLPEVVGNGGDVLPLPERCTPRSRVVPTAEEVAPWLRAIERIWDDPAHEVELQARAREAARRWAPEHLVVRYESFFAGLTRR